MPQPPTVVTSPSAVAQVPACLAARGVCVRYGTVQALSDVSVSFRAGEVHAIVGENGAGKSTLMRVLAGEEQPDAGGVELEGVPVVFSGPLEARDRGISVVHQHSELVDQLCVFENMFLGHPPVRIAMGPFSIPDRTAMRRLSADRLRMFGMDARVDSKVRDLSVAERQLVEIARAVGTSSRILVLDEPTASLSASEADNLFIAVRAMTAQGACVILIAHSLEEVLAVADRVTVLRNGRTITTVPRAEVDRDALVKLIIGREPGTYNKRERATQAGRRPLLSSADLLRDREDAGIRVGFELAAGEIVGIPTYIGAGVDNLLADLGGSVRARPSSLSLDTTDVSKMGMRQRVRMGICLIPGDAMKEGLIPAMSIQDNILLPSAWRLQTLGVLSPNRARKLALRMIRALDIRPADPECPVKRLSGGNRQKVVIAKWLAAGARVLLMDDPTKAVDVGAKMDIYQLMNMAASEGAAIVLVSSEVEELVALCDRILVVHQGTLVADYDKPPFAKETVLGAVVGSRSARVQYSDRAH